MHRPYWYAVIAERKHNPSPGSYTAQLFAAGEDEMVKKMAGKRWK